MPIRFRGRQTQFYIDIVYGVAFSLGFGYLLFVGMDPRVAAFQGGLVLGYFLRVWENMSVYEQILEEEVAAEAEEAVAEEVADTVPGAAEEQVSQEIEDRVPEQVTTEVEEQVEQAVERQLDDGMGDQIEEEVERRLDEHVDGSGETNRNRDADGNEPRNENGR